MKKVLLVILMIPLLLACPKTDEKLFYSKESGKQALEDNMINMLNEIDAFRNDTAITEIEEFAEFMLENEPTSESGKRIASNTVRSACAYGPPRDGLSAFSKAQLAVVSQPAENLKAEFDAETGIYIWNSSSQEFDYNAQGSNDEIIFKVTQNNKMAVLTISNFSTITHPSEEEIPTSLNALLTVDDITLFSQEYSASFDEGKYIPNSVSNTIVLGSMSFTLNASSNSNLSELTMNTDMKLNGKSILSASVKTKGNYVDVNDTGDFDQEINDLIQTISATYSMLEAEIKIEATAPSDDLEDLTLDEEIALVNKNLKVSLSVNEIKVADGEFYKKTSLEDVLDYHNETAYQISDARNYKEIELLNDITELENSIYYNNYKIYTFYEVIEESVVSSDIDNYIRTNYPNSRYKDSNVYASPNYRWYQTNYYYKEQLVSDANLRFVFEDGSKSSVEAYFNAEFNDFEAKIEDVLKNYEGLIED